MWTQVTTKDLWLDLTPEDRDDNGGVQHTGVKLPVLVRVDDITAIQGLIGGKSIRIYLRGEVVIEAKISYDEFMIRLKKAVSS